MSSYVIKAVLSNPSHPEYGQVTVPFPIPDDDYGRTIEMLSAIGIGSPTEKDCRVDEVDSGFLFLNRLEGSTQTVNVDELDYLAKRLDSFDVGEAAQYEAMLYQGGYWRIEDMINLTFCCQQATVITDFSDLEHIGRDHAMTLNGGSMLQEDLDKLDARSEALKLIQNEKGVITPSGVVYDNGMKLEQIYKGKSFPAYLYDWSEVVLAITPQGAPEDTEPVFLYLPSLTSRIERTLLRAGITGVNQVHVEVDCNFLPSEVSNTLELENETIESLNELCQTICRLSKAEKVKLNVVVECASPSSALQIARLAENLELFNFAPHATTPEELGKYMVKESGHFEYDPNLEDFYDFKKLGEQRTKNHPGCFTKRGYISYEGTIPLEALMTGGQLTHSPEMGGMA